MLNESRGRRRRRIFDMSLDMTLLLVVLLACVSVAAAQSEPPKSWAAAPMAATVTVVAPSKELPAEVAGEGDRS